MDGTKFDEMKRWKCKAGHLLGVYEHTTADVKIDGRSLQYHTAKLLIFRQAVDAADGEKLGAVDVAGTLLGRMLLGFSWKCSVPGCGCIREWNPDDEALDWLKKRFDRKDGA